MHLVLTYIIGNLSLGEEALRNNMLCGRDGTIKPCLDMAGSPVSVGIVVWVKFTPNRDLHDARLVFSPALNSYTAEPKNKEALLKISTQNAETFSHVPFF